MRLTPAQRAGLAILATPDSEARPSEESIRWSVRVGDAEIGTIHSETLMCLRRAGLVRWISPAPPDWLPRQSISDAGRAYVEHLS